MTDATALQTVSLAHIQAQLAQLFDAQVAPLLADSQGWPIQHWRLTLASDLAIRAVQVSVDTQPDPTRLLPAQVQNAYATYQPVNRLLFAWRCQLQGDDRWDWPLYGEQVRATLAHALRQALLRHGRADAIELLVEGERGRQGSTQLIHATDPLPTPDPAWLRGGEPLDNAALLPVLIDALVHEVRVVEASHGPLTGCAVVLDEDLQTGYLVGTTAPNLDSCCPDGWPLSTPRESQQLPSFGWRLIGRYEVTQNFATRHSDDALADDEEDEDPDPPWRQLNLQLWLAGMQGAQQALQAKALFALTQHGDTPLMQHSLTQLNAPSQTLATYLQLLGASGQTSVD